MTAHFNNDQSDANSKCSGSHGKVVAQGNRQEIGSEWPEGSHRQRTSIHTQPDCRMKEITMKTKTTLYSCLAALGLTFSLGTQAARANVTVTVLPGSQVAFVGSNVVFSAQVSTTAGETITGYTWKMSTNGVAPFNIIAGATTATCTLTSVQMSDAGSYFTQVTYNSGTNVGLVSVSAAVALVVHDQARITSQPQGGFIRITGTNVSFSVTALGLAPLSYQWRLNGLNLANGARITGANGANLTVSTLIVADSGSYDVVVTNLYAAATSQVATLTVFAPPGIAVPPANLAIITGSNASFSVTPTGSAPLSFRWIKDGTPLSNSGRISGATNTTLTITAATTNDAGGYSVLITNIVGWVTSSVATLTVLVPPTITSATSAAGKQGTFFSFTNTATGTLPITFGVDGYTNGLSLEPTNGIISGIPLTTGVFSLTIYATNAAMTTTGQLVLIFTTGVPGINSALTASGKQGTVFSYTITASNNPTTFSASALPAGLNFDPVSGIISGPPIVSGIFPIMITASNQFGGDAEVLTLTIASAAPSITSARTAAGTENVAGFSYTIRASNTPTTFGASGLPLGLMVNPTNGVISGTPWFGGTFTVPVWADNAWGTGTTNVVMTITFATLHGLAITDVINTWSKPYLLDFSFSLRDGTNPVVRLPIQFQVVCMEDGVPISSEAPLILDSVMGSSSKQLKTFLVLDYTYSMFVVPGAIRSEEHTSEL